MRAFEFFLRKSWPVAADFVAGKRCSMTRVAEDNRARLPVWCRNAEHGNIMIDGSGQVSPPRAPAVRRETSQPLPERNCRRRHILDRIADRVHYLRQKLC